MYGISRMRSIFLTAARGLLNLGEKQKARSSRAKVGFYLKTRRPGGQPDPFGRKGIKSQHWLGPKRKHCWQGLYGQNHEIEEK